MMKVTLTIALEVPPKAAQRWLQLDGEALLAELQAAVATGEEITVKVATRKEVTILRPRNGPVPPLVRLWEGKGNGEESA